MFDKVGLAMGILEFLFEASIIPYMTLAGPLIVTLVHRSSLHPGGWCGFILDIIGLILLLGSIALIGFEYYWSGVLGLKFDISNDYNMIVAVVAILVYGFNSYVYYSRKVPAVLTLDQYFLIHNYQESFSAIFKLI